jgi:hypothetical protein
MDECIWNIDKITLTEKHTWWEKKLSLYLSVHQKSYMNWL